MAFFVGNDFQRLPYYAPGSQDAKNAIAESVDEHVILVRNHASMLHSLAGNPAYWIDPIVNHVKDDLFEVRYNIRVRNPLKRDNPDYPAVQAALVAFQKDLGNLFKDYQPVLADNSALIKALEQQLKALKGEDSDVSSLKTTGMRRGRSPSKNNRGNGKRNPSAGARPKRDESAGGSKTPKPQAQKKFEFKLPPLQSGKIYMADYQFPDDLPAVFKPFAGFYYKLQEAMGILLRDPKHLEIVNLAYGNLEKAAKDFYTKDNPYANLVAKFMNAVQMSFNAHVSTCCKTHDIAYLKYTHEFGRKGTKQYIFESNEDVHILPSIIPGEEIERYHTREKEGFGALFDKLMDTQFTGSVEEMAQQYRELLKRAFDARDATPSEEQIYLSGPINYLKAWAYNQVKQPSTSSHVITTNGEVKPRRPFGATPEREQETPEHQVENTPNPQAVPIPADWTTLTAEQLEANLAKGKAPRNNCSKCSSFLKSDGKCPKASCSMQAETAQK